MQDAERESGSPEEEIPAWLLELGSARSAAGEPEAASVPEEQAHIPDWLQDLRASFPAEEEAAIPSPPEEQSVPDWLARLRPIAEGQLPADLPEFPEAEDEDVPGWLAELHPLTKDEAAETAPAKEEDRVPDWLSELHSAVGTGAAESAPAETYMDEAGIPTWLAELRPATTGETREPQVEIPAWLAEVSPAPTAAEAPEPQVEIPAWLAEVSPAPTSAERPELSEVTGGQGEEEAGAEEPSAPAWPPEIEEGDIPDWIAAMRPKPAVTEPVLGPPAEGAQLEEEERPPWLVEAPSGQEAAEQEEIATATMPDWLQAPAPAGPPTGRDAGSDLPAWLVPSAGEPDEESLARAEIPAWLLALKPAELREEDEPDDASALILEPVEETGLLAGLRGTLPVEMLIAQPRAVVAAEAPPVLPQDTTQSRLFAEIVGRGPEVAPKVVPQPGPNRLGRVPLWIISLALLVAVTLPLLVQRLPFARSMESPAWVLDLYERVEALDPGRPVLVAFEYDPSSSDEMNVLAEAVVGHLLDRGIPVVAVSLQPAGPPVAQSVLEELAAGRPGARYVNLGYISGQAAGVQLLDQGLEPALLEDLQSLTPADQEMLRGVTGFESFGLLLVLAAEPDSLRIWIEQAGALQDASLAAAVSASTEPIARSYYETDPRLLLGLLAGVPGAATYESLLRGDGTLSAETTARLDSLLAGHAVFVIVLAVGSLVYLVRRGPRGRR
jgi:hypothetical protein